MRSLATIELGKSIVLDAHKSRYEHLPYYMSADCLLRGLSGGPRGAYGAIWMDQCEVPHDVKL